jgi:hypothetical protein
MGLMHSIFLTRRNLLVSTAVLAGSLLVTARGVGQETGDADEGDALFFICGCQQITTVSLEEYTAGSDVEVSVDAEVEAPEVELDPYTTAQRALKWQAKDVQASTPEGIPIVRIKFKGGTDWQQQEVMQLAEGWRIPGLGMTFQFVAPGDKAEVTIAFTGTICTSKTGKECKAPSYAGEATTFLPEVIETSPQKLRQRAVLHELGHALMAFGHEQFHLDANYQWRDDEFIRDSVNAMLTKQGRPASWTVANVRLNITRPPYSADRTCTAYDTASIMHYPVLKEWITAGTPVPVQKLDLSASDKQCALEVYA